MLDFGLVFFIYWFVSGFLTVIIVSREEELSFRNVLLVFFTGFGLLLPLILYLILRKKGALDEK